jgi:hypothetical protein
MREGQIRKYFRVIRREVEERKDQDSDSWKMYRRI